MLIITDTFFPISILIKWARSPRAYAITGFLAFQLLFWPWRGDFRDLVTLILCLFSIVAFFFETFKQYRAPQQTTL